MYEELAEILYLDSSAEQLNKAINATKKPYIAFCENKATLSENYIANLVAYLEKNKAVPAAQGLIKTSAKEIFSSMKPYKGEKQVFDSGKDFSQVLLYPHGLIVRTDILQSSGIKFSDEFKFIRNEAFALQFANLFPQRYFDGTCIYIAEQKFDESNPNGQNTRQAEWYWESTKPLYDLLKEKDGSLKPQNQYALIYIASVRFKANYGKLAKDCFEHPDDKKCYIEQVKNILELVSNDVLFSKCPLGKFKRQDRYCFAVIRNNGKQLDVCPYPKGDKVKVALSDTNPPVIIYEHTIHKPEVQNMNIIDDGDSKYLKIDMRLNTVAKPNQYKLICRLIDNAGSRDTEVLPTQRFSGSIIYFEKEIIDRTSLVAKVPLPKQTTKCSIKLFLVVNGQEFHIKFKYLSIWNARLINSDSDAPYWSVPGYIVRDVDGVIVFEPASHISKIKQELKYWKYMKKSGADKKMILLRKAYWLTRPLFKNKRIWVYYDKIIKAGDNADFAYAYAKDQKDGIEKYYYLEPESQDWQRLKDAGYNLLVPKTPKGMLYLLNAELIYITHNPGLLRLGFRPKNENHIKTFFNPACIRLFHGFPNNRNQTYNQTYQNYAGVVVCSEYERQLYESPANEYKPNQIIPCSNPRYDELTPDNQHWIVFAPTWRPTLRGKIQADYSSAYNPDFKSSRYFRMYNTVLTDEMFLKTARRTGYKVKVFLHPRMAPQTCDFENNDVVEALNSTKDMTYVEMMRKADLMVTDYSSVQYDFASMHKPVVYYHDPTLPYWRVVELDYESIGFGEICKNPKELIDVLCDYMERDCKLSEKYAKRIDDFFLKPNGTASKELYEATRKIMG